MHFVRLSADRDAVDPGRRRDPPHRPAQAAKAKNLLSFLLIQDVAHPDEGPWVRRPWLRLGRRQLMAGFAVSINGGIWVSTEAGRGTTTDIVVDNGGLAQIQLAIDGESESVIVGGKLA